MCLRLHLRAPSTMMMLLLLLLGLHPRILHSCCRVWVLWVLWLELCLPGLLFSSHLVSYLSHGDPLFVIDLLVLPLLVPRCCSP